MLKNMMFFMVCLLAPPIFPALAEDLASQTSPKKTASDYTFGKKDFMANMEKTFDSMDKNHDGVVSVSELSAGNAKIPSAPSVPSAKIEPQVNPRQPAPPQQPQQTNSQDQPQPPRPVQAVAQPQPQKLGVSKPQNPTPTMPTPTMVGIPPVNKSQLLRD